MTLRGADGLLPPAEPAAQRYVAAMGDAVTKLMREAMDKGEYRWARRWASSLSSPICTRVREEFRRRRWSSSQLPNR